MGQPLVTVSIPYHGCPNQIRRAVLAVLGQTMPDLWCVVTNDADQARPPWQYLRDIDDPRLVRVDRAANRGRYHQDASVLAACDTPWWTVHDADDQADPGWLESMLLVAPGRDVVLTAQRVVNLRGRSAVEQPRTLAHDGQLHHYGHMAGLWRTEWLKGVGGPHPGYRVGYDTMLSTIARASGDVGVCLVPLYTRFRRPGSLTTSRATGNKSSYRQAQRARLAELWRQIATTCSSPEQVGRLVRSQDLPMWTEVYRNAQALRRQIGTLS
jgi:hypothetical protein